MYTEEYTGYNNEQYDDYNEYTEEQESESWWKRNRNIIAKIIVIILCLIILIWLIAKLTRNNKKEPEVIDNNFNSNITELRKASEKYFFLDHKLNTTQAVTLNDLISENRINDLVTSTGEKCDASNSYTVVSTTKDYYEMAVTLKCNNKSKTDIYYYNNDETRACINCGGDTLMDGTSGYIEGYSCDKWSEWSSDRKVSEYLDERTKTMLRAERQASTEEKVTYGEWSEYGTTLITPSDTLEVRTKVEQVEKWEARSSGTRPAESDNIRNISSHTEGGYYSTSKVCPEGSTSSNGKCYKTVSGTKTQSEWMRLGKMDFSDCRVDGSVPAKWTCSGFQTEVEKVEKKTWISGTTTYTYEEKVIQDVTKYSSRTVKKENINIPYAVTDLIDSDKIPAGYTKINGSEVTYYSYKLNSCEK